MNKKEVISEVTKEKNEQKYVSNKGKYSFFKNKRAKQVYVCFVCIIVGIVIGRENIANKYNSLTDEYNKLLGQVEEQKTQISELEATVHAAKPWFDMDYEEKRKVEEQNAKVEAEKRAERKVAYKKKAEEASKKAEEEKLAKEEKEKNKYNTDLTYNEIARNPEKTLSKNCKFTGEVAQVIEGGGTNNLRVAVNGDYDKMMLVEYKPSILKSRILEKDSVTLYGTSSGTTSYTSTLGAKITIPAMVADKIDIN
ncbi:hypothetical protein [Paraclostridium sordellii]|uniref:hypothetical protein n=1 Tax=Paraclostridium sordellii TaxID=1505 RepID=UPI0005E95281|nr:hypothetical protein [Paeniclostridium sordellii]CEN23753.1 Negative regulator of toxin gene expression [[Clostridium] sordellii] [Paeniclostridium sordellii]